MQGVPPYSSQKYKLPTLLGYLEMHYLACLFLLSRFLLSSTKENNFFKIKLPFRNEPYSNWEHQESSMAKMQWSITQQCTRLPVNVRSLFIYTHYKLLTWIFQGISTKVLIIAENDGFMCPLSHKVRIWRSVCLLRELPDG